MTAPTQPLERPAPLPRRPLGSLSLVELVAYAQSAGVDLWVEGERLRFSAPRGALTPELRDELTRRKQDLLAFLDRSSSTDRLPPIAASPRQGDAPLSFGQERLWFFDQFEPGSAAYNMFQAVRLRGRLVRGALERAVTEVIDRHEVLRSRFVSKAGEPVQQVVDELRPSLPCLDLSALPQEVRRRELRRLSVAENRRPFDLGRAPLLRWSLLRLAHEEHVVLITFHHIASDGWSIGVFVRELLTLYEAFRCGRRSPLPPLPLQYSDFAVWQRRHLTGARLERSLAWWRRALESAPATLDLPVDHPQRRARAREGVELRVPLGTAAETALRAACGRWGATPFMVLLATFHALLHRYTGSRDILVGSPVAGRDHLEVEDLIGFFVNTLVMRGRPSATLSFEELVGQVRESCLGAYAHQDLPLERLVEELRPDRAGAPSPLFQVLFAVQNAPAPPLELPGLTCEPLPGVGGQMLFDLTLGVWEGAQGTDLAWGYRCRLFEAATVQRLADHFRRLLTAGLDEPSRALGDLALLSPAETRQLVVGWNDVGSAYPADVSLVDLLLDEMERRPEAVAVSWGARRLTYGELSRRSGELAGRLAAEGVRRGDLVGVALERGVGMVVALVGTLRAGAAYVPLDGDYPDERLAFMLRDTAVPVVLVDAASRSRLSALIASCGVATRALDPEADQVPPAAGAARLPAVGPDDLAYVIYTSGSTGTPKGVAVPQRAVVRLVRNSNYVHLETADRIAQISNASFDAATFEIWGALLNGGCLVGVDRADALDPRRLAETLSREAVSALFLTTALFNQVIHSEPTAFASVGTVLVGGEALDPRAMRRALEVSPPARLLNIYGPTESTTFAAWHPVREVAADALSVPIGDPLANTTLHVVDAALRLVPVGVAGELVIGGDGLAHGYLRRPGITAARFIPDPFSDRPGARLYRSGDLVRRRADGAILFLGRLDDQVKLRGFRIELGEVEAALLALPEVRAAAVLVSEEEGDRRLVAYVTSAGEGASSDAVREALRRRLPEYMVPAAIVLLDELPVNANGKLDRAALAVLSTEVDRAPGGGAPLGPVEEVMAGLWSDVLGVTAVGRDEDFFDLGGHSLLATRLVSRIREALAVELELATFFAAPTVAAMTRAVAASGGGATPPPLEPAPRPERLPLSFAQQRLWFLDRLVPGSAAYNIPALLRLRGELRPALLRRAFDEVVRRHESLRTTFEADGDHPFQCVHPPRPVRLPMVELAGLPAERRQAVARQRVAIEAAQPFDLARGPLLRCLLLRLGPDDHVLLVDQHHIVSDGWSAGVLTDEVTTFYTAFAEGKPAPLPELPVQYADYALWQQRWLQGETLEKHLEFWRQHLAGASPLHALPTDRPRPPVQSLRGSSLSVALPAALRGQLETFARGRGATLFMVLLAAYQAVLGRWAGVQDVVAGAPVAGRDRREIERLIGFFVNVLPLRADLGGGAGFGTLVERVRDGFLAAHRHRELPVERLVEHLVLRRDASYPPLFQVVFALQTAPAGTLEAPGLTIEPLSVESGTAKFDLTLSLQPSGDALTGSLEYSTALFDAGTVERFVSHFHRFLEAALVAPERPVEEVPLLPEAERRQVLREWPVGAAPESTPALAPDRAREAAASDPAAPAVVWSTGTVSYGHLAELAARVAAAVRRRGVGPEGRVGVCAARSPAQVAALLGVAWAGAAAVPLDPAHPRDRRLAVLADAGASLLLGDAAAADLGTPQCPLVRLDAELAAGGGGEDLQRADAQGLAYVVYTSGSTGVPKGVAVEHRGLANLVAWHLRRFELSPRDRVSHLAGLAFDASVWEVWPALCAGAALHLPPEEVRGVPEALRDWLLVERITVAFAPTPLAEALVELRWPQRCDLRLLLTGGDRLHRTPPSSLPFPLVNAYGPTENSVVATAGTIRPSEPRVPHIGGPIDGVTALVLDRRLAAVPVGVAGELCLGGAGLARGYLGRPAATAAAFVPHPSAERPGERLYRTGDRARWRADGRLDFLGRLDRQVQIRGFRVEPAEVEAVLTALPEVREAAVVPVGEEHRRRLAAFVVWDGPALEDGALRRRLSQSLPAYMLPALCVALPSLPVDRSGKVERGALAAHVADLGEGEPEGEAPATPSEQVLAEVWRELLQTPSVARGDDFFARGGHSLLATRLVARVRDVLAVELPLRTVFEAPTLERMAEAVDRARRGEPTAPPPQLTPQPRSGADPLSFSQQRLWFLDRLLPGSPAYNIPTAYRVRGPLSPGVLAAVLQEIVGRHEVLRTTFAAQGAEPVQVVGEVRAPLPVVDLAHLPAERREAEAKRLATVEARRPFDLEAGPPSRFVLLRQDAGDHALLSTLHHAVADGWSAGVLVGELAALYTAFAAGRPSPLAELPVQYADYAIWQRRWLAGPRLEAELDFWRRRLAGAPEVLELAADRPRPAVPAHRGAVVPVSIEGESAAAFLALARRNAVTPFMALLALFATLLSRWSGSRQVVVGTPVAGRSHSALEGLVGCFVNTLPLPVRMDAGASFSELAAAVREAVLDVFAHQHVPFERLVEELAVSRDVRHSPLFQVMLTVQDRPVVPPRVAGLEMEPMSGADSGTAKFDLTLALTVDGDALRGGLEFDLDLFDRSTVESLAASLVVLAERVVAEPAAPLDFLPLLDDARARQVLVEWNELAGPARTGGDPVAGLRAQAVRQPQAPAVIGERELLTFGELEERSNRLAHHLRRLGVGPEERVAVRLERSAELLVVLLAVLKAGGAYVPLAADSPVERVLSVLTETRPRVWVAAEAPPVGAGTATVELRLDRLEAELAALPATPPPAEGLPENLAYVLYTSGSTGRPKGVMVTRGGLAAYLAFAAERYAASGRDGGVPLHSSVGFDLTVTSLFVPLLSGRPVHVVPEGSDVAGLAACLRRAGGTDFVKLTPGHLQVLAHLATEEDDVAAWTGALVIGGEALTERDLVPWRRLAPRTRLINEYGPTETVVGCSFYEVPPGRVEPGAVPIGRPVPGARLYVLDHCGVPLPPAAAGELFIGGATVSRGYLGRPAQTAERYVPDPFGEPGARLYRTGDLVRQRADGELVFLGRRDNQVKLRGVRIELGEIENVLAEHPAVREVVVALRGAGGDSRLLAYVVADPTADADLPAALLAAAARRLPGSMVPATVVVLDRLPLTLHGKVDRAALPLPVRDGRVEARAVELPRNRLELDLQRIWEEVLDVRPVGVDEDFFALGGHSLLGIYIVACVRERLGVEVPLHRLFQAPTIAGLADAIERPEAADEILVPLQPAGTRPPLFVVHGAGGDAFHFVLAARELAVAGADRPWIGIQSPGLVPGGEGPETVEAMADLYIAAVRGSQPRGPYYLGGYSMGGLVAWQMARRLRDDGEEVPLVVLLDARADQSVAAQFDERRLIGYFASQLRVPVRQEDLSGVDGDALLRQVIERGRELGRIPRDFGLEEARRRLRVMRSTLAAAASFRPTRPFDGRTILLRAEDEEGDDPTLGWGGLAAGGLEVIPVPGDHRSIFMSPHVEALARHLAAALDEPACGAVEAAG